MLALHTYGVLDRSNGPSIIKILGLREALAEEYPADRVFIDVRDDEAIDCPHSAISALPARYVATNGRRLSPSSTISPKMRWSLMATC